MQNLSKKELFAFWLSLCTSLTNKKQHTILNELSDYENIFNKDEYFLSILMRLVDENSYNKLVMSLDENILKNYLRNLDSQNIKVLTIFSVDYPEMLKEISTPPIVLYCKGDTKILKSACVSIVGTRRCTKYGKEITTKIATQLSNSGLTIVSGLADGVDTLSHKSAVDLNNPTIAVLGSGFNYIYPANNLELSNAIVEKGGLLISEFQPNEKPQTFHFPMRNRIIAGLSKALIVTEAPLKSGALITKDFAMECNREVFAVPGRLNDIYSLGCNQIIKDCQANILTSVDDVLKIYDKILKKETGMVKCLQLSINEQLVFNLLSNNDLHYQELLTQSMLESKVLNTTLMQLELKDLIKKLPGNIYSKVRR